MTLGAKYLDTAAWDGAVLTMDTPLWEWRIIARWLLWLSLMVGADGGAAANRYATRKGLKKHK
jgi:hypothetical protein